MVVLGSAAGNIATGTEGNEPFVTDDGGVSIGFSRFEFFVVFCSVATNTIIP